jgi:hypothetical protein
MISFILLAALAAVAQAQVPAGATRKLSRCMTFSSSAQVSPCTANDRLLCLFLSFFDAGDGGIGLARFRPRLILCHGSQRSRALSFLGKILSLYEVLLLVLIVAYNPVVT